MAFGTIGRKLILLVGRSNIILRLVASNTNLRSRGQVAGMAKRTLNNGFVPAFQLIARCGMVEGRGFPGDRGVTGGALLRYTGGNV